MTFVNYFPGRGTLIERTFLEGEAKGVLRVLEVRGIPVSDGVRERILICTELERVNDWLDRAGSVDRAEDLFTGGTGTPASPPA
ncbi:hypothetical protein [Streptomyces sp. NPDC005573]|uniref:hypothetical protein n=1 Tax=Streptomyces sp. NPDC005573 TaxID=3156890 RepID=UPI0033A9B7C9